MKSTGKRNKTISILNRILISIVLCIAVLCGVVAILLFRQSRYLELSVPYETTALENTDSLSEFSMQAAAPFASELCVSEGTVTLQGVALQSADEKGFLLNMDTGEAIFAQGIYDRIYPASITKIMTALLAIQYGNMEDQVVMEESDFNLEEGSQLSGMAAGDIVTMEQLFYALVVHSANDAAMAIARQIGGTAEHFVEMMNEEALRLGMTGTHFTNPHGLHDPEHYTTAYDIYLMLNEAFRYSMFREASQLSVYQLTAARADGSEVSYRLDATDQYLTGVQTAPKDVTLLGGKTGTTDQAGSCLALIAQNAYGIPHIAIILNAQNHAVLYQDMNTLLMQINS